jgi:hypothetical protein
LPFSKQFVSHAVRNPHFPIRSSESVAALCGTSNRQLFYAAVHGHNISAQIEHELSGWNAALFARIEAFIIFVPGISEDGEF